MSKNDGAAEVRKSQFGFSVDSICIVVVHNALVIGGISM